MPENAAFKKAVRAYAADHGLPYAAARTAILATANTLIDAAGAVGGAAAEPRMVPVRRLLIQQATRENLQRPYPFEVDEFGYVVNQSFWNGDPWLLIGFEDRTPAGIAAAEATQGPGMGRNIALTRQEWLDNPQAAIGLHPVFTDFDRTWSTHVGEVVEVGDRTGQEPVGEVNAVVTSWDGSRTIDLDVTRALARMPRSERERLRRMGWKHDDAGISPTPDLAEVTSRILGDDPDLDALFAYVDDTDPNEDTVGYTVTVNPAQAEAWFDRNAAHR